MFRYVLWDGAKVPPSRSVGGARSRHRVVGGVSGSSVFRYVLCPRSSSSSSRAGLAVAVVVAVVVVAGLFCIRIALTSSV